MTNQYFTDKENLDASRCLFGLNFTNSRNVWIFSIDQKTQIANTLATEVALDEIPVRKRFTEWIHENYKTILTQRQVEYVEGQMGIGVPIYEEETDKLARQKRYQMRGVMQKNVMNSYFKTDQIKYSRRLEYNLEKLNIIRKLRRKASSNESFISYILDNLDTNYINELVYGGKISEHAFKHIQYARATTGYIPKIDVLNEIYEIAIQDLEKLKSEIFCNKSDFMLTC